MPTIIDTAEETTKHLTTLKQLGVQTIIRYINPLNAAGEKTVKIPEAKAIAAAGMRLGLVCEGWGGTNNRGIDGPSGRHDGPFCRDYAPIVGTPEGACIYFAVDVDATANYIKYNVLPYFAEIKKSFINSKYRIGVYGAGAVCEAVKEASYADLTWLSNAMGWNGSRAYRDSREWAILQHLPADLAGLDTDPDEAVSEGADIGDFIPWQSNPVMIPPIGPVHDLKWLQGILGVDQDGLFGPKTLAAMIAYIERKSQL